MDIVCEIDGVLASLEGRKHLAPQSGKGGKWVVSQEAEEFFELGHQAEPIGGVTDILFSLYAGHPDARLIINTHRPSIYKSEMLEWLYNNQIKVDAIFMRPGQQTLAEHYFKRSALRRLRENGFDPKLAFEWDWSVADMYHEEGLNVLTCYPPKG